MLTDTDIDRIAIRLFEMLKDYDNAKIETEILAAKEPEELEAWYKARNAARKQALRRESKRSAHGAKS